MRCGRTCDTRVQAQTTRWREAVRRIASQHDPTLTKPLCHLGLHPPGRAVEVCERYIASESGTDDLAASVRRERFGRMCGRLAGQPRLSTWSAENR